MEPVSPDLVESELALPPESAEAPVEEHPGVEEEPDAVPSATITTDNNDLLPLKSTAVDGVGMWRSWTRVFAKPESACLDLLDNCFDATGLKGTVFMEALGDTAIAIQNNSHSPVKPLEAALTIYKSSKNAELNADSDDDDDDADNPIHRPSHKDSIGENGVGLKQGCATLSDCSIVLTRNVRTVEIGVLAKQLQSSQGVYLPSFSFNVRDHDTEIPVIIERWLAKNPAILAALSKALLNTGNSGSAGTTTSVHDKVTEFAKMLWKNPWDQSDHVFLLILCNLKQHSAKFSHELIDSVSPAKVFLQNMKMRLPKHYVNLPSTGRFDFVIDKERINFSYWQRRLVELTRFEVYIPTDESFESLPDDTWDQPGPNKYKLSIYCGFDAQRVDQDQRLKQGTSTCMLYIYSCQAGRLIQEEVDARYMLGLSASGVDFTQGLTILINDVNGKLPLTPTKDGIAWSERTNGKIHQRNLLAWTGALAQFFWTHHRNKFAGKGSSCGNKTKEVMKKTIRSFAQDQREEEQVAMEVAENLEDAQFTKFACVKWKRIQATFDNRWKIRKSSGSNTSSSKGQDTLFCFSGDRIRRIKEGRIVKRKASVTKSDTPNKRRNTDDPEQRAEGQPWEEIDPNDITMVAMGILGFLRQKDKDNLFEAPVVETAPEIRDSYLEKISTPMDFRTIEETMVQSYSSIKELQQDLTLVFQNCIEFNGADTPYGSVAQRMLGAYLDDAFESMDVEQVKMRVLSHLRDLDERELFENPVLEEMPELKDAYLQVVQNPMDFRTIEEKAYMSISELRGDVELIFENCIRFNGADTTFGQIAQQMLDRLDEAFENFSRTGKRRGKSRIRYDEIVNQDNNIELNAKIPYTKAASKKKKAPYNKLEKKLRDTEKLLQAERATVKELRKQLGLRNQRIRQLESKKPLVNLGSVGPSQNPVVTPNSNHRKISDGMRRRFDSDRDSSDCSIAGDVAFETATSPAQGSNFGCMICQKDENHDKMLLCEGCDDEYHFYCLSPPLTAVPDDDWYCGQCADPGLSNAVGIKKEDI